MEPERENGMKSASQRARSGFFVVVLCFLTIVADGYDLIVYGATVPSLLTEPGWGMTPSTAGPVGSWTLVGLITREVQWKPTTTSS